MSSGGKILLAAGVFLIVGLLVFFHGLTEKRSIVRQYQISMAWLFISMSVTFATFSLFPTAQAQGKFLGFTIGGAGAFTVLVWMGAFHVQRKLSEIERQNADGPGAQEEGSGFPHTLTEEGIPEVIRSTAIHPYKITRIPNRSIGIVTGDLRGVRNVDLWVNSENTDMQMSRMYEKSISGLIRYEGSRLDAGGRPIEDVICDELTEKTKGTVPVEPGTAVFTGSGELLHKNDVHFIIHVAAVRGEPAAGYRQTGSIDRCVVNALRLANELTLADGKQPCSIVFPLLGAGSGRGERLMTARIMVSAAVNYLIAHNDNCIRDVFFLARTDVALTALHYAIHEVGGKQAEKRNKGNKGRS